MTITYRIDGPILIVEQNRETDPRRIGGAVARALADPALPPQAHMLWDARDAPAQADASTMKRLLEGFAAIGTRLSNRFAVLVANDVQFGVSRMLAAYADEYDVEVDCFYDPDEARAWLLREN